jgi:hypothetical protein
LDLAVRAEALCIVVVECRKELPPRSKG